MTDSDQKDQALREMAEQLDKELTLTQRLLKIARLYQRTTWAGERASAAEAFARAARGTPWKGLTPEEFLRAARRPAPEPDPSNQPEPEAQTQRHDRSEERRQDQRKAANSRSNPQPANQKQDEAARWIVCVFLALTVISAAAGGFYARARNPSPQAAQTSSSGPQVSQGIPAKSSEATHVVAVESEQQAKTPPQNITPAAPKAAQMSDTSAAEVRAKTILGDLVAAFNNGDTGLIGSLYAATVRYYGKPAAKPDVLADKLKFMQRWPNRNYSIREDSLTVTCSGTETIRCTAAGLMDFDASNASKRSTGITSFTYVFTSNNLGPPSLEVTAENSSVITRDVTDAGQRPAQTVWPPLRGR